MADNDNSMQAQLGLFSAASSSTPIAFPTPAPPPMAVRHPGEMSQLSAAMAQSQAATTIQTVVTPRITPGPGMGGGFGQQFGANMASLNSQMFNPYVAQTMANVGGFGGSGFMPGMLPSPVNMTSPNMGIFRNAPQNFAPTFPPTPPMPLIPFPGISPTLPAPSFRTPTDFGYDQARYRGMQQTAAFVAAPGVAVRGMTDFAGSKIGAGLGAFIGHRFGGMRGAGIGGTLGALGGLIGAEAGGFGEASQRIVDRFNPLRTIYNQAQQLQTGSVGYVSGGSDLEVSGRGLGSAASRHLAVGLRQFSRQMPSSGDSFTNTDMLKMTQMAGDVGLLNMSQTSDQIVSQMKTVAKSLKVFMQLAGEPDMRAAMKSMGQLYAMGLTAPEIVQTAQNAKMFSRMAGTTVQGIMEAGQTGAAVFQSNGLTAGLGMNVGMGALGMATSAVAGGAYSPQLLALQGGVHGIAQREMMAQAATLKMPMLTAAASSFGGGGGFTANGRGLGGMNLHQMTTAGANNLIDAVSKGGVGALGMYQLQEPMLQDQIGRQLGPLGMKNQQFQNVLQTMKMLGLSGQGGFATTAQSLYGKEIATDLVSQASSPEFFANMQRQIEVQRNDLRGQAKKQLDDRQPGFFEKRLGIAPLKKRAGFQRFVGGAYELMEDLGNMFDFTQENAAEANGQALERTPTRLLTTSDERARMSRLSGADLRRSMNQALEGQTTGRYRDGSNWGFNARGEAWGGTWSGFKDSDLKDSYNRVMGGRFGESLQNVFTSREEMERKVRDADRTGRILMHGKTMSDKESNALMASLDKGGIDASFRDEFARVVNNSVSREGLTTEHRRAAHGIAARRGITITDQQADDLLKSQGGLLAAIGGDAKSNVYATHLEGSGRGDLNFMTVAQEQRTSLLRTVTQGADEKDADEAMALLNKSGDPDVAAYAALAFSGGDANAFLATLGERGGEVQRRGNELVREINRPGNEHLHDAIRGYAATLQTASAKSKTSLSAAARVMSTELDASKSSVAVKKGFEGLGISKEVLQSSKDIGDILRAVHVAPEDASAEMRKLASRHDAAKGDGDAQAAIEAEAAALGFNRGSGTTGVSMTGGIMAADEVGLEASAAHFGKTAAEMREIFKEGKNPLLGSAISLDYAATRLIEAAGKLGGGP